MFDFSEFLSSYISWSWWRIWNLVCCGEQQRFATIRSKLEKENRFNLNKVCNIAASTFEIDPVWTAIANIKNTLFECFSEFFFDFRWVFNRRRSSIVKRACGVAMVWCIRFKVQPYSVGLKQNVKSQGSIFYRFLFLSRFSCQSIM